MPLITGVDLLVDALIYVDNLQLVGPNIWWHLQLLLRRTFSLLIRRDLHLRRLLKNFMTVRRHIIGVLVDHVGKWRPAAMLLRIKMQGLRPDLLNLLFLIITNILLLPLLTLPDPVLDFHQVSADIELQVIQGGRRLL